MYQQQVDVMISQAKISTVQAVRFPVDVVSHLCKLRH